MSGGGPFGVPEFSGDFHCGRCGTLLDGNTDQPVAARELREVLRETYDYMVEVEQMLAGQVAVRSYLSLPRTAEERTAIGKRARAALNQERVRG